MYSPRGNEVDAPQSKSESEREDGGCAKLTPREHGHRCEDRLKYHHNLR